MAAIYYSAVSSPIGDIVWQCHRTDECIKNFASATDWHTTTRVLPILTTMTILD